MSAFDDFLALAAAERCWLLEIDAFPLAALSDGTDASGAYSDAAYSEVAYGEGDEQESSTLYYSSHGYTSQSGDLPALTWYDGRVIAGDITIDRRLFGRGGIGGLARTFGSCALINADGGLDALTDDYGLDGRPARLLLGRPTDARSAFGLVFSGVVERVTIDLTRVHLDLSDGAAKLDAPINPTTYAGTGALEGGGDLAGKAKPLVWGKAFNAALPLVDGALLIYQAHNGAINDVPAVYDRGIALTQGADYASESDMQTTAPAAGQYRVWKAGGFLRLGATPAGTVTADVLGDANGGYVNTIADILERVLLIAGIDASIVDAASIASLAADAPAEVGIYVALESVPVADVAENLLESVGAFGGFSRLGLFTAGVIKVPSGAPVAEYGTEEIRYLARVPLPPAVEPVAWRARCAWSRNYTVQTDLAAAVTAARRTFAAQAERVAAAEDLGVRSRRRLAREYGPTGNLYVLEADALTEAQRLLALWSPARGLYRAGLPAAALGRDLGEEVRLTHPRHGFAAGRDALVLGHRITGGAEVELMVLA